MTNYISSIRQFNHSFKIQLRVIYALFMREIITRYGRHNVGFMWLFLEPMTFTLGVATIWSATKNNHGGTVSVIPFAVLGYSTILLWRNAANRVTNAVEANTGLLYHRNVKILDVFLGRIFLEIAGATMSFLILSTVFIALGVMELPKYFLLVAEAWFFLAWFAVALGLIIGSLCQMSEIVDRVWHALAYLLFPLSGAAFFANWLPLQLREIVLWIPMVHPSEMIKHGYYGDLIPTYENVNYLIWCNMIMSFIGLILTRYVSRKAELN